jgi:hypothetical protein
MKINEKLDTTALGTLQPFFCNSKTFGDLLAEVHCLDFWEQRWERSWYLGIWKYATSWAASGLRE